ncbi:MAG: hypothetical protein IJE16_01380 [Ruminococcus sp.]|nr:hypothetical protein [Ruminococcus sp.]
MKKLLALALVLVMLLSLTACGGKDDNTTDTPTGGSAIETGLFTLNYDAGVWTYYEEETSNEEDYCSVLLQIPDPEDSEYYLIEAEIEVSIDEPYDFREDLVYYGFDQYEYEVNKKYETVSIGGVDLLKYDDGYTLKYFNRIENAGATVEIDIDADDSSDARIADLLNGIKFNLTDIGNEDGPWEWEGTPFSASAKSAPAGSLTIESNWIELDEYISTYETFDHSVAAVKDTVYLLVDGELRKYTLSGGKLTFVNTITLDEDDYTSVEATSDGTLWLSGSMNDIVCLKNDTVSATYEDIDDLAMHPSGSWGIDYFTSSECEKITFSGGTYTATAMNFAEVDTIMHLNVDENNIYVCGSDADSNHKVFVYGADGKLKTTLCDAEGESLGSITFMAQSKNGYIGFDGNMRDVLLWDNNGKFVAEISDSDLFSTSYPWFCNSALLSDGSIVTIMTEEREDRSATELIVFTVKGF